MKNMLRLISLLLLVILCFSACDKSASDTDESTKPDTQDSTTADTGDNGGNADNSDTNNTQDKKPETALAAANALQIANNNKTSYKIVIDDRMKSEQRNLVETFRARMSSKTGATMKLVEDNESPSEKEILIYTMDDRIEVLGILNKITAPEKKGYRIEVSDSKIIVACEEPMYLSSALDLLSEAIRLCDDGSYGIEKDYVGKLDLPALVTTQTENVTFLYTSQQNYTASVANASKSNYSAFVKSLREDGFYVYDTNSKGSASFGTYVKDSLYGQQAVYTMYYPDDRCYKVTYGPLGYLPDLYTESDQVVTPFFSQPKTASGGLRSVMRLENGKFIVFDGGNPSDADQKYFLEFLQRNSSGSKVEIAAWVITHAHGDHLGMVNEFLNDHAKDIELDMVVYNFPDWENSYLDWDFSVGDTSSMKNLCARFQTILADQYPNTKHWVVHTGQTMKLPGCDIEVLFTPEDYATWRDVYKKGTINFPSGNHTNIALRLTINGTTIVTPGDSEAQLCKWMGETYGEDLKSDVLYLTHHGYNGGDVDFYRAIDPDICIWPTTQTNKLEYQANTQFPYNQYLINTHPMYPGRDRVHHTQDVETIYEITDKGPVLKVGTPAQ